MTYQEQVRRDKLRKLSASAYARVRYAPHKIARDKAVKQWLDVNARLEQLTDKTIRREDNAN